MQSIPELEARRNKIAEQMLSIRSMRRGTINEQYLKVAHKGKEEPVLKGPYYVISRRQGNKTVSVRLTSASAVERAKKDVENHKLFNRLCRKFEAITEKMGELRGDDEEKKHSKSSSSRTKK
jgi:hypothetical protein